MANKKSSARRVPRSQSQRTYGNGKPAGQATPAVATTGSLQSTGTFASSGRTQVIRTQEQLATEYHYVLGDLRRLGILAAGTFAVLVLLGIVIK